MVLTPQEAQAQQRAWVGAVLDNGVEFAPTKLSVLSGRLPTGLRGSLYRNGPAHFERSGQRVGHWFDGDGAILAVHFTNEGATGVYRYVQTQAYQEELQAEKLLYGGFGTLPNGKLTDKIGRHVKHVANTSVLVLSDRLLALWEMDCPYQLDPRSLETIGMDTLGLSGKFPYSAHPKQDPYTKEIFNFGVSYWVTHATLNLYRSDASGQIKQRRKYLLPHLSYIHDIALAGRYLIVVIPPIQVHTLPHLALLQKPVSECMTWQADKAAQIWIFDRTTLQRISRIETEPWFHWHFSNGYEAEDGSIVLSIVRYENFQTKRTLGELVNGQIQTPSQSALWELRVDPYQNRILNFSILWDRTCEMPLVHPDQVGQNNRYSYVICHRKEYTLGEWFRAIARYDHHKDQVIEADFGEWSYPSEVHYVRDVQQPERAWLLTVVYNGKARRSEIWIFDAQGLDADPVCRLELPEIIPLTFHGTWQSA
jgi:all-trans-8'-apo-beta-carotenal 15,15'-oxygenase